MKIFFHSAYWGYRGTEVALYDYAHHAEKILGAESAILVAREKTAAGGPLGDRFRRRFRVVEYGQWGEAEEILAQEKADLLYTIKNGFFDGIVSSRTKTAVHAIFMESDFHGDRYAYLSSWLARTMVGRDEPWVPFMVDLPSANKDLRSELGIPSEAVVLVDTEGQTPLTSGLPKKRLSGRFVIERTFGAFFSARHPSICLRPRIESGFCPPR